jgi:4-hydroxybenzoate polyprenyltransferase
MFDIANTTTSVEEDKLNKPHRPIPSGLMTVRQAQNRWLVSWCLGPVIMALLYGEWPAFYMTLGQVWVFGFYVWPAYRHWLTKSTMVTGATFIMLRLLNSILWYIEEWRMSVVPDLIVCVWTITTIHLQDFRDMGGDYITHKATIPLMFSPKGRIKLRQMTAAILFTGNAISLLWVLKRAQYGCALLTGLFFYVSSNILTFYTITSSSRHQDRIMYRWWMTTGFGMINHVFNLYFLEELCS